MKPTGGSEITYNKLVSQFTKSELNDFNVICSNCHFENIQKNKINILWQQLSYDQTNVQNMTNKDFVNSIDCFAFVSHWQFEKFRKYFNVPEERSVILRNATTPFKLKTKRNKKKLKLIYTSTPWRGLNVLIESIKQLNEIRDDFEIDIYSSTIIYGDGFYNSENKLYEKLFDECRNTKNINYKGYATNQQIRKAVSEADIMAYPNIFEETSCISVIEAMSAGCYMVTTNYGVLPETATGFATYEPYQPNLQQLADNYTLTLNECMDNYKKGEYNDLLKVQQKYFNIYYSWNYRIKEWRKVFKKLKNEK